MLRGKLWTPASPRKTPDVPADAKQSYEELMLGVWRVLVVKDSPLLAFDVPWGALSALFAFLSRVIGDFYAISPRLFVLSVAVHAWFAIEGPLAIHLSNRLFFFVEKRISGDAAEIPFDLYVAVMSRVACSVFTAYVRRASRQIGEAYDSRIKYDYQARLFSAKLACDLQTIQEQSSSDVDTMHLHRCFELGLSFVNDVISFLLHLRLIVEVIGSGLNEGGPVFIALCVLPPFLGHFTSRELWQKAYVASPVNEFYIRKSALEKLSQDHLRQEVLAGGINNYLMSEYRKAKDGLGDTPDTSPEILQDHRGKALSDIAMGLGLDGPTLYFALMALIDPSKLSIVRLAVLNQVSTSLRFTFESIQLSASFWPASYSRVMDVYATLDANNGMKDGTMLFPRPGHENGAGIGIQVQDVSFSYPKTKSDRAALTSVSFTIQPGQLVVIVGANGSGKSTIIKLLSRFYEPTSGSILIDGAPIEAYRMDALRKGIAMLTQEHQLFPLSVRENIQLGSSDVDAMHDQEKVRASVLAAGAEGVVEHFSDGYDTVLDPVGGGYISFAGTGNKELEAVKKRLDKPTSVSGGEKQKLVAARTFMRLFTSPVKLVTVDEPSSALDPEAEYRLFTNLRRERGGRTMIFVTHRFGHLTKHADLIICMKEGAVVETGTHSDLLSKRGEYARLYDVQAQAFASA